MIVTAKDVKNFGPTSGCGRCERISRDGHAKGYSYAHTVGCRGRMMVELSKTPDSKERLAKLAQKLGPNARDQTDGFDTNAKREEA